MCVWGGGGGGLSKETDGVKVCMQSRQKIKKVNYRKPERKKKTVGVFDNLRA